jgi:hypothetical protein
VAEGRGVEEEEEEEEEVGEVPYFFLPGARMCVVMK